MNPPRTPHTLRANGIEIAYLERSAGVDAPLVVCVHGFPDTAWSFVPVLDRLAAQGYRAVAPFLRGYAPTEVPADGDVRWTTLATDLIEFIRVLSPDRPVHLVGHDWGSIVGQFASKMRPDVFRSLVLCAVPHLGRFFFFPSLAQLRRSHYILRFQVPGWAERRLPQDDFAWIKDILIRRWSPGWRFSDDTLDAMVASFREPARLKAAVDYYRGLRRVLFSRRLRRLAFAPIRVPTLMVYASDDGCIGAENFDRQQKLFPAGLTLCEAKGMGHFMNIENPAWFAAQVLAFIADKPPPLLEGKPMTTTTTPSGLVIEEVVVGDGDTAAAGQYVTVHYTGWLTDGKKFDSSKDRNDPFAFDLGARQVIAGWDEGVQGMKIGGTRKLTIPPQLGYGARGAGGVIPPNATLVFEVELLAIG